MERKRVKNEREESNGMSIEKGQSVRRVHVFVYMCVCMTILISIVARKQSRKWI